DDMLQPQPAKAAAPVAQAPTASASTPALHLGAPGAVSTVTVPVTPKAPLYSPEQLGVLLEVSSAVQCECPNHLSQIVSSLQAFEEYSKHCENRNEADRQVHALLYRYTAAARAVMEEALTALVKHENIKL
ncbi:MAG TPA: hypothetical protein VEZ71_30680, partial [Archangium sp.]|nr:hypothetical protein [Archangium sp.]